MHTEMTQNCSEKASFRSASALRKIILAAAALLALFLYLNERGIVEKNVLLRIMFQKNSVKSTKLWKTRSNLSKFSRQVKKGAVSLICTLLTGHPVGRVLFCVIHTSSK